MKTFFGDGISNGAAILYLCPKVSNGHLNKIGPMKTPDTDQRIKRLGEPGPSAI
jgi:hypothetical protein